METNIYFMVTGDRDVENRVFLFIFMHIIVHNKVHATYTCIQKYFFSALNIALYTNIKYKIERFTTLFIVIKLLFSYIYKKTLYYEKKRSTLNSSFITIITKKN